MRILSAVAIILVVAAVLLFGLFGRRELFARTRGTVELYLRLYERPDGRGWSPGFAQFRGDELRWFRVFSFSPRPRRRLSRRALTVDSRRAPTQAEAQLVPAEWVVLRCQAGKSTVEIA